MVGGCLSCFCTYISVLLLGLHDVEASSCGPVVHQKVGDTVELSSCLSTEGVTLAIWNYEGSKIADKDADISEQHWFTGRLDFNPTSFSLTVRGLTLRDSGDFMFVSEVNDEQRKSVTITLQVHEPLTKEPKVTYNSTWHASNESCTVWLECSSTSDDVTYSWMVRNQTMSGSRLQYNIRRQDGDTEFTCMISNIVSNVSMTRTEKCTNLTTSPSDNSQNFIIILSAAGGGCLLLVVIVGVLVWFCHGKQSQESVDSNDLTVYADISEVAIEDGTMKPCTLYETIDSRVNPTVTPGPQTVYDKVQFSRMKNASVSPYQEIS